MVIINQIIVNKDTLIINLISQFFNTQNNIQSAKEYDKMICLIYNKESLKRKANSSVYISESQSRMEKTTFVIYFFFLVLSFNYNIQTEYKNGQTNTNKIHEEKKE
jgi:hypothetical protein